MKSKIFYKVIFGVAVFMVVVVAISVFGLLMLSISAVQAMLAQKGLPEWSFLAFAGLAAVLCAVRYKG